MRHFFIALLLSVLPLSGCLGLGSAGGGSGSTGASGSVNPQELEGHRWKAISLNGTAVQVFEYQDEPHLVFLDMVGTEPRLAGSDGCNRVIGLVNQTDAAAGKVLFGSLGATMMACPKGFDQSRAFMEALGKTDGWGMKGDNLVLMQGGSALVELAPVNLD